MATAKIASGSLFLKYSIDGFFDEMFSEDGSPRPHYARIYNEFAAMRAAQFEERRQLADAAFLLQGITFTVYNDGRGTERLFPFDLIPRILPWNEWEHIERGTRKPIISRRKCRQE